MARTLRGSLYKSKKSRLAALGQYNKRKAAIALARRRWPNRKYRGRANYLTFNKRFADLVAVKILQYMNYKTRPRT